MLHGHGKVHESVVRNKPTIWKVRHVEHERGRSGIRESGGKVESLMNKQEKVINDLMLAIRFVESHGYGGVGNVMRDAIELLTPKWPLKEDAPRVLTLEEMLYSDKELICEFRY